MNRSGAACMMLAALPAGGIAHAAGISLDTGLVVVTTYHGALVNSQGQGAQADTELVYSVGGETADAVEFDLTIVASSDARTADAVAHAKRTLTRFVRREDLAASTRLSVMWTTADPDKFPGQTFLTTSSAALAALKATGETSFVVGINELGALGGLAKLAGTAATGAPLATGGSVSQAGAGASGNGAPQLAGAVAMFFGGGERHYYRGTLHRVETTPVSFSVLLNGIRTDVPAVHARGQLKFADQQIMADFYWLDAADSPLTLKWTISGSTGEAHENVTRIDQGDSGGTADQRGTARGHMPDIAGALGGNACHAELHGVYFATGSAELLPPSGPALRALAAVLSANPSWVVTVEGHTDNLGSADYNLDLSTRRANAVRGALITDYHVAAGRLTAKGYGLTRPMETNATEEGRAHNRRVEIARQCP